MALRRGKRNLKLQVSEETPAPVYVKHHCISVKCLLLISIVYIYIIIAFIYYIHI